MNNTSAIFKDEFHEAVAERDARRVGGLVDALRFDRGWSYTKCFDLAHELTGIDVDEWEQLLYEADVLEALG